MRFLEKSPKVGDMVALEYGTKYGEEAWGVYKVVEETNWLGKKNGKLTVTNMAKGLDKATAELWAAASNA